MRLRRKKLLLGFTVGLVVVSAVNFGCRRAPLEDRLLSPDHREQAAALKKAAKLPTGEKKRIAAAMIEALREPELSVAYQAMQAIEAIGEPAAPGLIEALGDNDVYVRMNAAEALGRIGEPAKEAVPALAEALSDTHPLVREAAALSLSSMGEAARSAVPALTAALKDEDPNVRESAVDALDAIGTDDARSAIPKPAKKNAGAL